VSNDTVESVRHLIGLEPQELVEVLPQEAAKLGLAADVLQATVDLARRQEATPDWRVDVARLAELPPIEADREMAAVAARQGCSLPTLRTEVKKARGEQETGGTLGLGRPLELPERVPWYEPVGGAALLDELDAALARHVVMPDPARHATALWEVFTYAIDCFEHAPRLRIRSPVKRCGKSTLLDCLLETCCRPLPATNVTGPALFRSIELVRPTLLLDEGDSFMRDNEEVRGLVNSGHRRSLAFVLRVVEIEGQFEPRQFSTWCPMAIASIGPLAGTIEDRSVIVELRRRLPGEEVTRLDKAARHDLVTLACKAARWAGDHVAELAEADPAIPAALNDRAADNWRPLLAIADAAGGEWPARAREAAVTLAGEARDDTARLQLLGDLRELFGGGEEKHDWLATKAILAHLNGLEERPWSTWSKEKPLNPQGLRSLLEPFAVYSSHNHEKTMRGYKHDALRDAWSRYLPDDPLYPEGGIDPSIRPEPSNGAGSGPESIRPAIHPPGRIENSGKPSNGAGSGRMDGSKAGKKGRKDALPFPHDLEGWRKKLRETLPAGRLALVCEWVRTLGGGLDDTGTRIARLPDLEPGTLRDAVLAAVDYYQAAAAAERRRPG
jgi:hypothetical protein